VSLRLSTCGQLSATTWKPYMWPTLYSIIVGWTMWAGWTGCSCGTGKQRRTRTCQNPKASVLNDMCNGDSVEYRPCSNNTCTKPDYCVVKVMKVFVCNPIFRGICYVFIMSSNSSYANLIRVAPPVSSHEYSNASKFNPKSVDFRCIF